MLRISREQMRRFEAQCDPVQHCPSSKMVIELVTDDGYSIPETRYRMRLETGEWRHGVLGEDGRAIIEDLPPNTGFRIWYYDEDDIRVKAFAARLNSAIEQRSTDEILGIISNPPSLLISIDQSMQRYFGKNIEEDCLGAFSEGEERILIRGLLSKQGYNISDANIVYVNPTYSGGHSV